MLGEENSKCNYIESRQYETKKQEFVGSCFCRYYFNKRNAFSVLAKCSFTNSGSLSFPSF
ncbi:hypothetical protein IIM_03447 [Bacillus cereus VD107]|nr:hypothetical protein IIM_03447 [Bacillus cereus VD107]